MQRIFLLAALAAMLSPAWLRAQEAAVQSNAPADANADGYEALARGPVHEAFAEPVELSAAAGAVVPKEPPEAIEEIPPEEKPAGDAVWMPGYWSWDDEREDFIWVSGVWRIAPTGQRWVAGYWTKADDGFRRVSGFWTSAEASELTYLPEPPPSQEAGPTSEPPSVEHFWIPGCWVYQDYRYAWRPGYWGRSYDNWLWVPQRYVWTPRGVIFTGGYWDYPLVRRGMLFSPIYFNRPIYRNAGYYYSPNIAINLAGLHFHLFARPRYHHYYFGDYHHSRYDRLGYYPWYASRSWGGYDPLFQFHWTRYGRHSRDWEDRIRDRYRYYRDNEDARPAHTYAEMQRRWERREDRDRNRDDLLAVSLRDAARDERFADLRLSRIEERQRRELAREGRERQQSFADRRREVERGERVAARPDRDGNRPREAAPTLELPRDERVATRPERGPGANREGDRRDGGNRRDGNRPDGDRREGGPDSTPRPGTRPERGDRTDRPEPQPDATPDTNRPDRVERPDRAERPQRPDRPSPDATDQPGVERPRVDQPRTELPRSERPRVERPDSDRPRAERPRVEQPRIEQPRPERPRVEQPRVEQPRAEQPRVERPRVERPRVEQPRPERQPRAEQPRVERPAPRVERPQPRVERPQARAERPQPQTRVAERPRVERPQPRVERPQPRVERQAPRAERPQPRASAPSRPERNAGRGNENRGGRGRGRD